MIPRLHANPSLKPAGLHEHDYGAVPQFRVRHGVSPDDVEFALGYDEDGIAAYPTFRALKQRGVIGPEVKFQLAMPTSTAILWNFLTPEARSALTAPYEARLKREIESVLEQVPAQDLAIQWDVAVEMGLLEGAFGERPDSDEEVIDQVVRMSTLVPAEVEMGYHLCYGDKPPEPGAKGEHFVQPDDAATLVRVANAIATGARRPVGWIHMPVPIERDDEAFFAPLADLQLSRQTTLYLGLMHEEDGLDGAQRRIAAASRYVTGFGVGTECGMGNEPANRIAELLHMHRDVTVPA